MLPVFPPVPPTIFNSTPTRATNSYKDKLVARIAQINCTSVIVQCGEVDDLLGIPPTPVQQLKCLSGMLVPSSSQTLLSCDLPVDPVALLALGESEYQTRLSELLLDNEDYLDTHASSKFQAPLFLLPIDGDDKYMRTAKPDLVSTVLPLFLEIKGIVGHSSNAHMYDVIRQSLERVFVLERMHAILSRAFCIALTGKTAWVIAMRREEGEDEFGRYSCTTTISIERIELDDVNVVWRLLVETARVNKLFYLMPDSVVLIKSLRAKYPGYNPFLSRIQLMAASSARVYGITFPSKDGSVARNAWDLAVKVSNDAVEFKNEVHALSITQEPYYVGHWPTGGVEGLTESMSALAVDHVVTSEMSQTGLSGGSGIYSSSSSSSSSSSKVWWDEYGEWTSCTVDQGGAIFMNVADFSRSPRRDEVRAVVEGILVSLQRAHLAGFVHCDVREANVR